MTIERRTYTRDAAPRADEDGRIVGRAAPFNEWTMIGKAPWGFREKIRPGAWKKTLEEGDMVLLDNHNPAHPISRMSAGTLTVEQRGDGYHFDAEPVDTTYSQDAQKNIRAGNYGGCSFGFEVVKEKWGKGEDGIDERELIELKVPEISVVTFPAYDGTEASMRSAVSTAYEVRSAFEGREAKATYADLETCGECGATNQYGAYCTGCGEPMRQTKSSGDYCSSCGSPIDDNSRSSHVCETRDADGDDDGDSKKPYGNVTYADPGYQKDKKKRYPVDTKEHTKAAWSYINKAKNAARYTAKQLSSIKAKIKSAAKKFGISISNDGRSLFDPDLFEVRSDIPVEWEALAEGEDRSLFDADLPDEDPAAEEPETSEPDDSTRDEEASAEDDSLRWLRFKVHEAELRAR